MTAVSDLPNLGTGAAKQRLMGEKKLMLDSLFGKRLRNRKRSRRVAKWREMGGQEV